MIVKSILDTDLYKFTTSYAYMKLFPHAIGTFEFFDRDNTEYTEESVQQLWIEISNFCSLKLTHDEQDYMTTHCRFIPPMYWEWLSGIRLSAGKVKIWLDEDKHLHIKATDYLYRVTLYEVPILAIVSELRNRMLSHTINMTDVQEAIVKSLKDGATYCTGTCKASPENDKLQDELIVELGPDVVDKIIQRHRNSRFKRLLSPIIVPRELYD